MTKAASVLQTMIIDPAQATLRTLARLEAMRLSPAVRERVATELGDLAQDLGRRLRREMEALDRLRARVDAFERRIANLEDERDGR